MYNKYYSVHYVIRIIGFSFTNVPVKETGSNKRLVLRV
jgi:hypothetical protein